MLLTEITTSATDALLALECIVVCVVLRRSSAFDRWRIGIWCWVLGLLAFASALGAVAHGLEITPSLRVALWKPLNLSLGFLVGLFLVGAFFDSHGELFARRLLPWSLGLGAIFFALTQFLSGGFTLFVLYEAAAMLAALVIYTFLTATHRLKGAGVLAIAILLNLAAAGIQASRLSLTIWVPFDHNGLFHLVQMVAIATLGVGLTMGMRANPKRVLSANDRNRAESSRLRERLTPASGRAKSNPDRARINAGLYRNGH